MGVNIGNVVSQINEKTKAYAGMKVPVTVSVDAKTKSFEITVVSPPTSALIMKEIGIEKGSQNPKSDIRGNISVAQLRKVAEMKLDKLAAYRIKAAVKEVMGVCNSMGVTVEGKPAREAIKEVAEGKYDDLLKE
jgi:large subunit ribosomal protein L11